MQLLLIRKTHLEGKRFLMKRDVFSQSVLRACVELRHAQREHDKRAAMSAVFIGLKGSAASINGDLKAVVAWLRAVRFF